jgi:phosphocarrier protein
VTLIVRNEVGLHARPAALFVQTAQRFQADITLSHDGREGNAKSLLAVLALGVTRGAEITIEAHGDDACQALAALEELVESDFGER